MNTQSKNTAKMKNLIIVVLCIIILLLISYIVINKSTRKNNFLSDYLLLQNKLSYYIGKLDSETFGAYDDISLLTSYSNDTLITNFNNEQLTALVDKSSKVEKDGVSYYKIDNEQIKEKFDLDLSQYVNITFYVCEGINIKVKIDELPEWWNSNFDLLMI